MKFRYRIYRNLHKGSFSIQEWNEKKKGYRVVAWESHITAQDCFFKVYEAGRQRVIKSKRKNVHAYLLCNNYSSGVEASMGEGIRYNPYEGAFFINKETGEKMERAGKVVLSDQKMFLSA